MGGNGGRIEAGDRRRGRARAFDRAGERERVLPWWAWALVAGGIAASMPSWAQPSTQTSPVPGAAGSAQGAAPQAQVPEMVKPAPDSGVRSDSPQVSGAGARPVPDNGVITPPAAMSGTTPVIKPPVAGTMPVIPPPGSAGGATGVVPK